MRRSLLAPVLAVMGLGFIVAALGTLPAQRAGTGAVALTVLLVGVAAVAAAGFVLRRQLIDRLRRMCRTLSRVTADNFVVRCEAGEDDLGKLGTQINSLLQKLTDLSVNVIDTDRELQWTQKELQLKEQISEKSRLLQATNEQLEKRLSELSLLFSVSKTLAGSLELESLVEEFCKAATRVMEVDRFAILVYDERVRALVVRGTSGFGEVEGRLEGMRFYPGEGVSGTVFEKRTMLYLQDVEQDHRFLHFRGKAKMTGSALILPLPSGESCLGVMALNRNRRDAFSFEDVGLFHIIANQVASAIGNAVLYQKTRDLAIHDELTGLYNRRMLERRLEMEWERSTRFNSTLSCVMLDVDHFKKFNDDFGHLVGDEVLKQTGQAVRQHVRKVDSVARFGGEEFAILLPRTEKAEAYAVAEKLREAVQAMELAGQTPEQKLRITISVGVASTQDRPVSAKELLDMADHALLMAKSSGRNCVVKYGDAGGDSV